MTSRYHSELLPGGKPRFASTMTPSLAERIQYTRDLPATHSEMGALSDSRTAFSRDPRNTYTTISRRRLDCACLDSKQARRHSDLGSDASPGTPDTDRVRGA